MKRRNFIRLAASASALGLFPYEIKAMLRDIDVSSCGDLSNRKLVLINLAGGNDGLNTVIPINVYDDYANLRPSIRIPNVGSNKYIELDNTLSNNQLIGLHPALTGFKSMYDQGWMRVLQSVGYPSQNKSHFESTDLYSTGNDGNTWSNGYSGWMGRFMEKYYQGELTSNYPLGVQIGSAKTSLGFHGEQEHGLAINITGQDPAGFYSELNGLGGQPPTSIPTSDYGNQLQYIVNIDKLSNTYSQAISTAFNAGTNSFSYPDTDLSNQLKTVARLISGGIQSKIFMVRIGGFDTHNSQNQGNGDILGKHNDLLNEVSGAVNSFFEDLKLQTLADNVVGLTFSEFGRKAKENGNLGTDHGEIAPMFVFGKPVNGGVSGVNVNLTEATASNNYQIQTVQYDYRQTFSTLLQDFLGASNTVIDSTFFNHTSNKSFSQLKINELLKAEFSVSQGCFGDTLSTEDFLFSDNKQWVVFPNPVRDILQILTLNETGKVKYRLFDYNSKLVREGAHELTNNKVYIDAQNLPQGVYILQIYSGSGKETHKVIKI